MDGSRQPVITHWILDQTFIFWVVPGCYGNMFGPDHGALIYQLMIASLVSIY